MNHDSATPAAGASGGVRLLLRLEGLAAFLIALALYHQTEYGWGMFALCFLAPDLSFLGYLAGDRVGAIAYNAAHSYLGAVAVLVASAYFAAPLLFAAGLIWCAHIGFDRALGYGLKYAAGFGHTHLGRIGRRARTTSSPTTDAAT
ncbi:DUF4260 domain-containing protein [Rudaea sp.]|uniref:DUF4260 domain-containing protein n=1 Tax=Rudaea sp. TaxID=2136325 RepID=UPI002ED3E9BA